MAGLPPYGFFREQRETERERERERESLTYHTLIAVPCIYETMKSFHTHTREREREREREKVKLCL